jgi:hypothetical protein
MVMETLIIHEWRGLVYIGYCGGRRAIGSEDIIATDFNPLGYKQAVHKVP